MKTIIGGSIAAILGLFGLSIFFPAFLTLLAGIIPLMLIIGGGVAIYLNYEDNSPDCCGTTDCSDNVCSTNEPSPVRQAGIEPGDVSHEETSLNKIEPEKKISKQDTSIQDAPIKDIEAKGTPEEGTPEEDTIDEPVGAAGQLLGNTGSLVFHNTDCKFSKSKNCTAVFNSKEEAITAGYKACGICSP
jgi:hypothetical protein